MTTPATETDVRKGATSASNALADSLCPGRHLMQRGQPDKAGDYAESGRKVHAALATFQPPDTQANRPELTSLSLEEREVYDACLQIEGKLTANFFQGNIAGLRVFREQRYWARVQTPLGVLIHSGQPDVVYKVGTRALIIEYKTLRGNVTESPKNLQLRDQAVLVRGNLIPTDEIGVSVIQPLVTHDALVTLYNRAALEQAAKEMFDRVTASNTPDGKRVAGEAQCKYCRATGICPEYQKWAGQITPPAMLTVLEVPMASWTPEQCAAAAGALAPADKLLGEIKAMLKARLEADPTSVPGWMLQPGAIREKITDPQTVFDRFVKLGGKIEQFMACVAVGKGDLKEAVNTVTGAKGKNLDAAIKTLVDGCVQQSQTAPSLKRKDPEPERAP